VTCGEVGLCGGGCPSCAIGRALSHDGPQRADSDSACTEVTLARAERAEITLADQQILSVTTFPAVDPGAPGASVVQVAKNVTEEIRSARRLRHMSDELGKTNAQLTATVDRLKSTQAQLLQAEKLSAIGQLVAGVAHELNNPLTSVIGFAQLLESELRSGDPARPAEEVGQDLRRIAEESGRAASIVRNLLAFARRQTAARAPQDVTELVQRVLSLRTYEFRLSSVELVTEFESWLPPVVADGSQLQQALLNLILNAERAMRGRPTRRLTVGARVDPRAGAVELFVTDTGHGIDHENLSRIFDPFFTTREVGEGTGLGLSICYGIVRDHGGQISVESRLGQGTTFKVLLPACARGTDEPLRALVAHRDSTERDYVTAALTGWGHAAVAAESASEARAKLAAGMVDVALIDDALVGAEPAAWGAALAAHGGRASVILMTEAEESGGVAPPYELSALRSALRSVSKECV
jgi:two-component system NtrC family sensor kinase